MEALRQYVISVVAAAMLCGIVVRLFPNGSGRQVGKLICGLFLAYTVLSPISRVDFSKLPDFSLRCMDDAEDAAAMGRKSCPGFHGGYHKGRNGSIYLGQSR